MMPSVMPAMRLSTNQDGTCDLILEYSRAELSTEFAKEFSAGESIKSGGKKLSEAVASYAKKARIKTVKILVSGVLVATMAFSSFIAAMAATDRYTMGYLYTGTDIQQVEYVNQTQNALDTVSPSYFDIREDGSLKLNYLSPYFIKSMHDQGIKVVPFLSNHWNRTAGINALKDPETLASQIAEYVEEYDLDGVNVDIENVTHQQRDSYTELVRLLREKIPSHKEISVAVAANPNNWQTGWHGSYDYAALAKYADHLVIMAYDEHYEGGEAGPVASIEFVENSIRYALSHTSPDKIVVAVPSYGRVWGVDNNRIVGKGISSSTIQEILNTCESTVTYDEDSQSVRAEFTITEESGNFTVGGDFILQPGRYVVWFENDRSYEEKLGLIEKYDLKGAGAWSLGQEDPSIWDHYEGWINGSGTSLEETPPPVSPPTSSSPEDSDEETGRPEGGGTEEDTEEPNTPTGGNGSADSSGSGGAGGTGNSGNTGSSGNPGAGGNTGSTPGTTQPESSRPTAPSQGYVIHRVQKGDTLWKLSQRYLGAGNRYPEIVRFNGLKSDTIYPGTQLKIPTTSGGTGDTGNSGNSSGTGSSGNTGASGSQGNQGSTAPAPSYTRYTVKKGDTLWNIARARLGSGSRYREIMQLNGMRTDAIYPGQILKLPK